MSTEFNWPAQYSFPPFFTLQPNTETRKRQLLIWSQLILSYCRENNQFALDKNSQLFQNKEISRQLSSEFIDVLMEDMLKRGEIEWVDTKKERCFIYWHSSSEWASIIYTYAQSNGLANTVETFYELLRNKSEFQGMDPEMFRRCLLVLQKASKVELIGDDGVKIF